MPDQTDDKEKIENLEKHLQKYQGAPRMSPAPEPVIEEKEIVKKTLVLEQMKKVDDRKRKRDECKSWKKNHPDICNENWKERFFSGYDERS